MLLPRRPRGCLAWGLILGVAGSVLVLPAAARADPQLHKLECVNVQAAVLESGASLGITREVLREALLAGIRTKLPRLKLLVTTGMRNASIDVGAAVGRGVIVCGTAGLPYPTAELAWGLILALARRIPIEDRATREGRWQVSCGLGLNGKTLGVIGLGGLGSRVAKVGRAFEMDVIAWSQNLTAARAAEVGATLVTKDELLARADVVSIHLVLGDRTRGLIGARELSRMKPTAFLVNTSRGPIVDEAALVTAVRQGTIAGAGLDVYDEEPLPLDHPLRNLPNTVITPHLGYVTEEGYRIFYGQALEDVKAWLADKPVRELRP